MKFSLGCLKDPIDSRDIPMGLVLPAVTVPVSFDFTKLMSPVRNQGDEGTCVAFASVVGVKENTLNLFSFLRVIFMACARNLTALRLKKAPIRVSR